MRLLLFTGNWRSYLQNIWLICWAWGVILGVAAVVVPIDCSAPLAAAAAAVVLGTACIFGQMRSTCAVLAFLAAGALLGTVRARGEQSASACGSLESCRDATVILRGYLPERPRIHQKYVSAVFLAEQVSLPQAGAPGAVWFDLKPAAVLRMTWQGTREAEKAVPLEVRGRLTGISASGEFADYCRRRGIYWSLRAETVRRSGAAWPPWRQLQAYAERWRGNLTAAALQAMPGEPGQLFAAMAFGDGGALTDELQDQLRLAGLGHILAASGLHVGLLLGFVWAAVQGCGFSKRHGALLAGLTAGAYALLAGFTPSINRAVLMLAFGLLALLRGRQGSWQRALAFAAAVSLLLSPTQLLNAGFQLSYAAVLGLGLWYRRLYATGEKLLLGLRISPRRIWKHINRVWSLTSAVSLMLWPLLLYHFGQFTMLSFISNLLVLPLLEIALGVGMSAWPGEMVGLGRPLWGMCAQLETAALWEVRRINRCPVVLTCADFPASAAAAYYLFLAGLRLCLECRCSRENRCP